MGCWLLHDADTASFALHWRTRLLKVLGLRRFADPLLIELALALLCADDRYVRVVDVTVELLSVLSREHELFLHVFIFACVFNWWSNLRLRK